LAQNNSAANPVIRLRVEGTPTLKMPRKVCERLNNKVAGIEMQDMASKDENGKCHAVYMGTCMTLTPSSYDPIQTYNFI